MTIAIHDGESIQRLRARREEGGGVFRIGKGLAVLDPRAAQEVNAASYSDMALPDRLVDLLRGRESPKVRWKEVRAGWISQLTTLAKPPHVGALADRLDALIRTRLDREVDLPWAIQEIFTQALIPTVIADLSPGDLAKVLRDQRYKLSRLMRTTPREETAREKLRSTIIQIRAGWVARRVLRYRARGTRSRQLDLADAMVDLLPTLGMDRATFALTSVFTAITGPPGAVAVCMPRSRPSWRQFRQSFSIKRRSKSRRRPIASSKKPYVCGVRRWC